MNIDELNKFFNRLKNDKKAMIILIIGLAGMLLILFSDTDSNDKINEAALNNENTIYSEYELSRQVEKLIENIDGAGKCKAMITYNCYEETVYAQNRNESFQPDGEKNFAGEYIIIDANNNEEGLPLKIILPEIKGIAIVCTGGENPVVKEQIISSLSALFNISSNRISVAVMAK